MAKSITANDINLEILDRLDKILRVLAMQLAADKSITDGARLLKIAGLDNQTIADVLNTSPQVIRTLTSNLRTVKAATRIRKDK